MSSPRKILHSAYSFVRSIESNKSSSALTLDHLIQDHVTALKKGETRSFVDGKGEDLGQRPSRWDRLDELMKQVDDVVAKVKKAGGDADKLKALGIFEVDQETTEDDA